ncbi:MAG: hypothetical protein LBH21_02525, partial [Gracilibacteraceae bacterium]|nr:hypothetical protein [Gracilibacteraceae bacterium]
MNERQVLMTRPKMAGILSLLTLALLLSAAPLFPAALYADGIAPDGSSVTIAQIFPDPLLANWVAQGLGNQDKNAYTPSAAELAGISGQLSLAGQSEFTDWTGIQYLVGLSGINFDDTNVTGNLSALAALSALTELRIGSPNVEGDIASLSVLTGLTELNLQWTVYNNGYTEHPDGNQKIVGGIAALANMTNLTELDLGWTGVSGDLADIAGLTDMVKLQLSGTPVEGDIASLGGMTDLEELWLDTIPDGRHRIRGNLSALTGLTKLRYIGLSSGAVEGNLTALLPLTGLHHLNIGTASGDTATIAAMSNLNAIWLRGDMEGDLAALAGRTGIIYLNIANARVYGDISSLAGLTLISRLNLSNQKITLPPVQFSGAPISVP